MEGQYLYIWSFQVGDTPHTYMSVGANLGAAVIQLLEKIGHFDGSHSYRLPIPIVSYPTGYEEQNSEGVINCTGCYCPPPRDLSQHKIWCNGKIYHDLEDMLSHAVAKVLPLSKLSCILVSCLDG